MFHNLKGPDGSMSQIDGLPNNSYKPITNAAWVYARLCKLQKWCTRLAAASDKVYQLLAHGRWFSPASSTTKTGRHDIAEISLKVALNTKNQSIHNLTKNKKYHIHCRQRAPVENVLSASGTSHLDMIDIQATAKSKYYDHIIVLLYLESRRCRYLSIIFVCFYLYVTVVNFIDYSRYG